MATTAAAALEESVEMTTSLVERQEEVDEHWENIKSSIQQLLDICAENEVAVPEDLRVKLLSGSGAVARRRGSGATSTGEYLGSIKESLAASEASKISAVKSADDIIQSIITKLKADMPNLDLRIQNGKYTVTNLIEEDPLEEIKNKRRSTQKGDNDNANAAPRRAQQKIRTVGSENPMTKLLKCLLGCAVNRGDIRQRKEERIIMENVNLQFEQGKMYLVLGAPGSGKSTLLKMIANTLPQSPNLQQQSGKVDLLGMSPQDPHVVWSNLVSYIDQIDRLHPYLTVYETCLFAWMCRSGGTHARPFYGNDPEVQAQIQKMDQELFMVYLIMDILGLTRVKDTFVGDQSNVRGVSGGEKRRVTVAEMFVIGTPVVCADEISTGLDAATTFDITRVMGAAARITRTIKIVSLLQPPPETVANFDDLILLSDGYVIYSGPVEDVVGHFEDMGYAIPERMDVADWLQALPTPDGWNYLKEAQTRGGGEEGALDPAALQAKHLSSKEFHEKFYESERGKALLEKVQAPMTNENMTDGFMEFALQKYKNSTLDSLKLVVRRELLLWWRDKYQIKAKVAQAVIMSIVVGTLFFQAGSDGTGAAQSIVSVLFQTMFNSSVSAMALIPKQFPSRSILYKHQDGNFFPTWCYVIGRSLATIPNAVIDGCIQGTAVFFMVGLAYKDGANIGNYFLFVAMIMLTSLTSGLFFSVYSASVSSVTLAQAAMAVTTVILVIFSGFTVQPDVIPDYWIWVYYMNYFAWMFRGFMINEFGSGKWDQIVGTTPDGIQYTQGQAVLAQFGFTDGDGMPYEFEWVFWGIIFTFGSAFASVIASIVMLTGVRFATGKSLVTDTGDDQVVDLPESEKVEIPFKRIDLTFEDIHYTVTSSITNEKLELLKGVSGIVEAGKMTALMGSSGAGKTTIMDVLAMRKSQGEITGDIRLNGHPQEEKSFRRCMGYVEQFDTQSPQLTIRETCEFSAKLRLEETDAAVTPETTSRFVQQALNMLELTNLQDLQVGSDEEGGLSFEQRKRLSIAVELVANPSILFLDEPTSGLDARAAAIVMRGLKRVAQTGRAVCATIHQPSIAIFNDFDSLLLLKRGGETVFFGELGDNSSRLIEYFERYDATPRIQPGENPATWMLTTIGAGSSNSDKKPFDYAGSYAQSKLHKQAVEKIRLRKDNATDEGKVSFPSKYATSTQTQAIAVLKRAVKVYCRSPSYNLTRLLVSVIVALIFASVYASQRVPERESDMNSRINSIFIAVLFLSVNAMNSVLSVFETERNMFYRHKASNMYDSTAILRAFTLAEFPFLFLASLVFSLPFYYILGFAKDAEKFMLFFAFVFLALSAFTFLGQMLVSLFRDSVTAQGFGSLVVAMTSLFSGVLLRPDRIPNFWIFMYWIMPGHYIMEGIFMSQFYDDDTVIEASVGSPFFMSQGCTPGAVCEGTVADWMAVNFADFSRENVKWDALFLVLLVLATRFIGLVALTTLDYRST